MKLYIIHTENQNETVNLLTKACESRGVEYELLVPEKVCPSDIKINPGDAVYRVATYVYHGAAELEWDLILKGAVSFRKSRESVALYERQATTFEPLGVPVPKTVPYIPKERVALVKCVEELGGFPICIKALGGSHGVGVMRVDSCQSLFSVSDFVRSQGEPAVLKEYCDVTSSARLIVLGDKVIDSIEYSANKDDFRSNEGDSPNVAPKKFDAKVEEIAVKAVKSLDLEFGGVDIMITETGAKVAEVNFPCFFTRCQMLTETDIAGQMVEYLVGKAKG